MKNEVGTLEELKAKSRKTFPNDDYYDLYEHDLTQIGDSLRQLSNSIIKNLKTLVQTEKEYWMLVNLNLFNFVNNLGDDGELPYY